MNDRNNDIKALIWAEIKAKYFLLLLYVALVEQRYLALLE